MEFLHLWIFFCSLFCVIFLLQSDWNSVAAIKFPIFCEKCHWGGMRIHSISVFFPSISCSCYEFFFLLSLDHCVFERLLNTLKLGKSISWTSERSNEIAFAPKSLEIPCWIIYSNWILQQKNINNRIHLLFFVRCLLLLLFCWQNCCERIFFCVAFAVHVFERIFLYCACNHFHSYDFLFENSKYKTLTTEARNNAWMALSMMVEGKFFRFTKP